MKKKRIILCVLLCIAEIVNIYLIIKQFHIISEFNIIPAKYLIVLYILAAFSVMLPAIAIILLFAKKNRSHKLITVIGCMVLAINMVICAAGGYYLQYGSSSIRKVTSIDQKKSQIGIYISESDEQDTADDLSQISPSRYLTLSDVDKDSISKTISLIEEEQGTEVDVQEFDTINGLLESLEENGGAAVLNKAYLDMLSDVEEYQDLDSQLRLVSEYEIVDSLKGSAAPSVRTTQAEDPFLMYISGIDVWGSITDVSRSDVNILMAVNPQTRQILLVNTPRDYYVPLSVSGGVKDKLTHAGIYGVDVSVDTLEMLYGVTVDYYFKLNFSGFEGLIDALGGITVWSDNDFTVEPIKHYVVGDNQLTGLEALAFARERYSFEDGDRQRGINQMNVIQSVVDKLTSSALLKNYQGIMDQIEGTFATDMSMEEMAEFVKYQLENGGSWDIQKYSVSGSDDMQTTFSVGSDTNVFVMQPDMDTVQYASGLLQQVLDGERIDLSQATDQ